MVRYSQLKAARVGELPAVMARHSKRKCERKAEREAMSPAAMNKRSGSRIRCVSETLFVVHLFVSVQPLNACPPEGPEALQACSLFQGTKAWLEPRLEPAELIPARPWTRSAVLVFEQHCLFACSAERPNLMNSGVNKRPERLQGVQRAATRPKWTAEHCLAA